MLHDWFKYREGFSEALVTLALLAVALALLNKQGSTVGVIEVKGGADPAGALERYGAAKKSFDEARRSNPTVKTLFVVSCITREVQTRIGQDSTISVYFNLAEILSETATYDVFVQQIFSLLESV